MQNVMVRIEIDPGVAVRHGGARAGRGTFQISEAPPTSAGIPARWADLYDRTLERVYRAEIRREIERLRGAADAA